MAATNNYALTETEQLLKHALDSTPWLPKQELAEQLGVHPSRISEGLGGRWSLSDDLRKKLIEKYGQPRGAPGQYVKAEVAESIKSFLDDEGALSQRRHAQTILKTLGDNQVRRKLAQALVFELKSGENFPEKRVAEVLGRFDNFLLSSRFAEWLSAAGRYYERYLDSEMPITKLNAYLPSTLYYNIDRIAEVPIPVDGADPPCDYSLKDHAQAFGLCLDNIHAIDLMAIGAAYLALRNPDHFRRFGLNAPFSFSERARFPPLIEVKEFVITGQPVWRKDGRFETPKTGQAFAEEGVFRLPLREEHSQNILWPTFKELPVLEYTRGEWDIDYWTTYRVELFINVNCNYTLVIELGNDQLPGIPDGLHHSLRSIVIPEISGRHVLDHLNKFRGWLELDELPETDIKQEIAKAGGYIPGATVL